jgi:hypothetical protein
MTTTPEKTYRIVRLSASNIKRLRAVSITPKTNVITIGGKNDNGKSSLLDSILYACAGASATCEQPIRKGANEGEVILDLGDLVVTKTFKTNSSPKLKVEMKGVAVGSPQTILDQLISRVALEPLAWLTLKADKQLELLRKLVGLDFTKLEADKSVKYTRRTEVNRQIEQKKAQLAGMPEHPDAPAEEVSAKSLMEELRAVQKVNKDNADIRQSVNLLNDRAVAARDKVVEFDDDIAEMEKALELKKTGRGLAIKDQEAAEKAHQSALASSQLLADKDEAPILKKIEDNDGTNAKVRANQERAKLAAQIEPLEIQSKSLTLEIDALEAEKSRQLSEAKFPLPGMSFDEAGVLLDNVPFSQAGMAKKILASVAIAMAQNPKLRVILVRDGSLLDDESTQLLHDIADKNDLQVWVECVGTKDVSVVIEDGNLKQ